MTSDIQLKLEQLLAELERDLQLCTTRDQHIRVAQRIADVRLILDGHPVVVGIGNDDHRI